jgi:hypothetical protein
VPDPEPTPLPEHSAQAIILDLLTGSENHWPLSVEEVAREISAPIDTADAIDALHGAGLIHRTSDGFVFPTRAAVHYSQIAL